MSITDNPTFLAVETRHGRATLGGRRRLLDDIDEAVQTAEEIAGRLYALEPIEVVAMTPVSASAHVRLVGVPTIDPEPRPVAGMHCPCGARGTLYEGEDRDAWDRWVESHDGCSEMVA